MNSPFDAAVVSAIVGHMNTDHTADNVLIVQAAHPEWAVDAATMTGFDSNEGRWRAQLASGENAEVRIRWPSGPITERREVRREIVALYDRAREILDTGTS